MSAHRQPRAQHATGAGPRRGSRPRYRVWAWHLYAWLIIVAVAPTLRLFGVARTLRLLASTAARTWPGRPPASPLVYARRMARLVRNVARRSPFRARCLEISATVWYLLRRKNIDAELVLASRLRGDAFESHAWVRVQETNVTDPDGGDGTYVELQRFDTRGSGPMPRVAQPPDRQIGRARRSP